MELSLFPIPYKLVCMKIITMVEKSLVSRTSFEYFFNVLGKPPELLHIGEWNKNKRSKLFEVFLKINIWKQAKFNLPNTFLMF